MADLEILKGGFNKNEELESVPKIFASATPTSGHVIVPCTSCALHACIQLRPHAYWESPVLIISAKIMKH